MIAAVKPAAVSIAGEQKRAWNTAERLIQPEKPLERGTTNHSFEQISVRWDGIRDEKRPDSAPPKTLGLRQGNCSTRFVRIGMKRR